MAMANGTAGLANSQLERLRQANRDIAKAHSDICCELAEIRRTGQGTNFSTVMGDIANQSGRVTQSSVMHVAMADGPLYVALRDIFFQPGAQIGSVPHRESVARVISQFSSTVAAQSVLSDVSSLMCSFNSEMARLHYDIDEAVSKANEKADVFNGVAKSLHAASLEFYDEQHPMASERIKVIDRFVDDREWVAKMLTRKAKQEQIVLQSQEAVERIQSTLADSGYRTRLVRDEQQKRKDAESELQSFEDAMIRRLRGNLAAVRQRSQAKMLDFGSEVATDGGASFASSIREYMVGREHVRPIVHVFMRRALGDYDPIKCTFFRYEDADVEDAWRDQFSRENEELADDILHALEKAKIPSPVGTPVPYGLEGKQSFTAQPSNGLHILFALQCQWYSVSAMHQENVMNRITDAAEHFRGGNPAMKIKKIVRPALKEALRLQLQVKAVNTLHPMMRILVKRDDGFKQLTEMDRYKNVVPNVNCSSLLMQFLTDVERVCEDLVTDSKVSAEAFWKSNKALVQTDTHMKRAFKAYYAEDEFEPEETEGEYYDAEEGDVEFEETDEEEELFEYRANFSSKGGYGSKGSHGSKGKGSYRSSGRKGKGGRSKGKGRGYQPQKAGYVRCDCMGCWNTVKANSTKKWGHICSKCVGWAIRNEKDSYRNRHGEMVQIEGAGSNSTFVATDRERALAKTVLNAVGKQDRSRQQCVQANLADVQFQDALEPSVEDEQAVRAQMAKRRKVEETGTMSGCMAGLISEDVDCE